MLIIFIVLIFYVYSSYEVLPFSLGYACMQGYVRFNGIGKSWISTQAYVENLAPPITQPDISLRASVT